MLRKLIYAKEQMQKQNDFVLGTRKNNKYMAIHLVMNELKIKNINLFIYGNA